MCMTIEMDSLFCQVWMYPCPITALQLSFILSPGVVFLFTLNKKHVLPDNCNIGLQLKTVQRCRGNAEIRLSR
jgi:hypothetical protein